MDTVDILVLDSLLGGYFKDGVHIERRIIMHWREGDGPIKSCTGGLDDLALIWEGVNQKDLNSPGRQFEDLGVYRLEGHWRDSQTARRVFAPAGASERIEDAEFKALAERLSIDVFVSDDILGEMKLKRRFHVFEADVQTNAGSILFDLPAHDESVDPQALQRARKIATDATAWFAPIKTAIFDRLYADAVEWHQISTEEGYADTDEPISPESFLSSLEIGSISLGSERIHMFVESPFISGGHAIEVRLTPNDEITEIGIAG